MSEKTEHITVAEVMHSEIETIEGMATIAEAIERMKERSFSALIVDIRDESDEYGLISVHDIARQIIEKNLSPDRVNVYEVMRKPVLTVRYGMNIRYAIRLLEQFGQARALVIREGKAAGIVTMKDMVVNYLAR